MSLTDEELLAGTPEDRAEEDAQAMAEHNRMRGRRIRERAAPAIAAAWGAAYAAELLAGKGDHVAWDSARNVARLAVQQMKRYGLDVLDIPPGMV